MYNYKGFITRANWIELRDQLCQIADTRGLENKLLHLYQPDLDMDDKICEDFDEGKESIILELCKMIAYITDFTVKIAKLEKE